MFLSIIVPVYNVKEYLIKCLDSIYNQSFDDYECIIVDDGSTDGSEQLVDDYCKDKVKFKVFHKENGGLMSAWTYGVKRSKGEYIGFVDSDDYIENNMYAVMCEKALKTQADIVMCDRFDVKGELIQSPRYTKNCLQEGLYSGDNMRLIKQMVFPFPGTQELTKARWNKIFKRTVFMPNLKYCECLSKTFEDRYITPPCVFAAQSFYYVKQPLYYYVHRTGSNSGMYKPDLLNQIKRLYYVEKQALEDMNLMDQYGDNWENIFIDYIRQYIVRNIKNVSGFKIRHQSATVLLKDSLVKKRLKKYGKSDMSKMGCAVYVSYKLNAPILLTIASYL